MKDCYENCPKINFKKGDRVRTTQGYKAISREGLSVLSGVVVAVRYRGQDNPLIKICVDGKIEFLDAGWIEPDDGMCEFKPLCCPSLMERIFCKPPCCGRRCC